MATVRINQEIRNYVRQLLTKMEEDRISKIHKGIDTCLVQRALETKFQHRKLYDAITPFESSDCKYAYRQTGFSICLLAYADSSDELKQLSHHRVYVTLDEGIIVPLGVHCSYSYSKVAIDEQSEMYEHILHILRTRKAVMEEYRRLKASLVDDVLGRCSTLRQVLEVWPSALDFMPDYVRDKHAEKASKRKKVREEIVVDDSVKASLAKARMLSNT